MRHSVAGIAIEGGKVFIARRKAGGDIGGKWEFPGGKVEEGEGDADALRREFLEEFGAAVTAGPLLATAEFTHNEQRFSLNAYRIFFTSLHFNMREHDEWRWAALEEIEALDFAGSDRLLLPQLQAYLKAQAGIENR
jgi:8-oxo-dGTP diphosphatase